MPFISAIIIADADQRVDQRQLVRNRGEAVVFDERQRQRAGELVLAGRNTRSHGTNTSSKTVVVSIILWRALIGCSSAEPLRGRRIVGRGQQHQARRVHRESAKLTA